jgi:hypothetical protein
MSHTVIIVTVIVVVVTIMAHYVSPYSLLLTFV